MAASVVNFIWFMDEQLFMVLNSKEPVNTLAGTRKNDVLSSHKIHIFLIVHPVYWDKTFFLQCTELIDWLSMV